MLITVVQTIPILGPKPRDTVRVTRPGECGLRNAARWLSVGRPHQGDAVALSRERVRRARLGTDLLDGSGAEAMTSVRTAPRLAVPQPHTVTGPSPCWRVASLASDDASFITGLPLLIGGGLFPR